MSSSLPRRLISLSLPAAVALTAVAGAQANASVRRTTKTTTAKTTTSTTPVLAPSGQTTTSGLLSLADSAFGSLTTGWTPYASGVLSRISTVGHTTAGALSVTSAGPWTGASSPAFAVTPGARYSAGAWARAQSAGHTVGLVLQFHDASGAVISVGNQLGQYLTDNTTSWSQLYTTVGIAPAGAVTGNVLFLDYDGAAGDVQQLDDVTVTKTTGTAAAFSTPLRTQGPNVVDSLGRVVRFRGIDVDGLQYSNTANVTAGEVAVARGWGANFIRLPLAENYVVSSDCSYDSTYLSKVDSMVNAATSAGLFIMLDLHTNAVSSCVAPKQQLMPDAKAVTFWQTVATRYKNNPLVGFDLYNEPHDVSDAVWHNGGTVTSSGVTYQAVGMQQLYDTVRGTGATNLVFASGTNWATAFPTTAPLTGTSNLIYAAHAYTCPSGLPSSGATCTTGPDGTIYDPSGLLNHFTTIGASMPVMVTEFGFPDKNDGRYIANLSAYVANHNWTGWDVYAFDNSNVGLFDLWKNVDSTIEPAVSGMAVITGMLSN